MPDTFKPVLMVAFGHPAADVVASASVQNYKAEQVHYNAYQGAYTPDAAALAERHRKNRIRIEKALPRII